MVLASAISAAVAAIAMLGDPQAVMVVAFAAIVPPATMIRLPAAARRPYNLGLAVAATAPALLMTDEPSLRLWPSAVVVITTSLGPHLIALLHGARAGNVIASGTATAAIGAVAFGVYAIALEWVWPMVEPDRAQAVVACGGIASIVWFGGHAALPSRSHPNLRALRSRVALRIAEWPSAATLLATGVFFGVVWQEMPWWWAITVAGIPYVFAHVGFWLHARTAVTYHQTIIALSRVPEASGMTPDGHGTRTADLAGAIALRLGFLPAQQTELEHAALLHDIGRLTLSQPAILRRGFTDEDIAGWGAEMIREAPSLQGVAEIVSHQHEPYRRPGEQRDPNLPMSSKIIRVASAYDHATTELGFLPLEALELLHRGAAYDFDPDVVAATRAVLETRNII